MAKKHKKRKNRVQGAPGRRPEKTTPVAPDKVQANKAARHVIRKKPEISAFWVAVIIPVVCFVGAWSYPPVATPMELKSIWSQIYLSGLLLFWLWLHRDQKEFTLTLSPGRVCFGLLFMAGTLSLLWAANPDFWVYKWNKWFAGFVMFLLGLQITQNEKNLDTIVNLAILGGVITATIGILQYLFRIDIIPQTSFPASTFGNGNMAGQVMVLTAPLPLYFLLKERLSTGKIWFYALSFSLLMLYTYYTRTRAVWIACGLETFLVLLFIVFDKTGRKLWLFWNKSKTKASIVALLCFAVMTNFNDEGFQPFWEIAIYELSSIATSVNTGAEEEGGQRYLIWSSALEIVKDNPVIGTGLGSFFDRYNTGGYANSRILGVQRVHNDVLELAIELGAVGLLLLSGIIVTVCTLLYKLILHSNGQQRLLFSLLTIAVTGSMLNAQLSFPYQLPVPLVIMPFYMAIIIRGSESLESNTTTYSFKPALNTVAIALSALVLTFILVNDSLWYRDIRMLNKIVSREIQNTPWTPISPIYNQAYFTGGRSVNQALTQVGDHQLALLVADPILKYWPDTTAHTILAAENYFQLGNYPESEFWARKTLEVQPPNSYMGQYYLMQSYVAQGEMEKLKELYEDMKDDPETSLSRNSNTYNMLHSMSINVQDFAMTTYFYDKFNEYFGEFAPVIANQAVFYINTGDIPSAMPLMKRALEMDPNLFLKDQFNSIMAQYPELSNNPDTEQ